MQQPVSTATVAVAVAVCAAITLLGTIATLHFVSGSGGDPLDIYKVGATWLIAGAVVGRVAYNLKSDKAKSGEKA